MRCTYNPFRGYPTVKYFRVPGSDEVKEEEEEEEEEMLEGVGHQPSPSRATYEDQRANLTYRTCQHVRQSIGVTSVESHVRVARS